MNEILRDGIDIDVAINSAARRMEIALAPEGIGSRLARAAAPQVEVVAASTGFVTRVKNVVLRPVARLVFRLAKPILRPVAVRLRSFLIDGLRQEVVSGLTDLARQHGEAILAAERRHVELAELHAQLLGVRREIETERADLAARYERIESYAAIAARQVEQIEKNAAAAAQQADRVESYAAAAARRIVVSTKDGNALVRTNVGYVVCSVEDEALLAILVESGDLEKGTRLLLERFLRPTDVFVDVGANLGMHSLAAARAMGGEGRVIAFEPFEQTVRLLERTIYLNGFSGLIEVRPVAVSGEDGVRSLYLGRTSGHHSLYPLVDSIASAPVAVPVVTLDDDLGPDAHVDLIKIDVEGAELDVLDGARLLLQNNQGVAMIVELGVSHLERVGTGLTAWLDHISSLGFMRRVIHPETGLLEEWSIAELAAADSVNLFLAREGSEAWSRLEK